MDLRELRDLNKARHPWEIARVAAIGSILKGTLKDGLKVLDIGCGDGYVSRGLFKKAAPKEITGVDINLSKEVLAELSRLEDGINYTNRMPLPDKGQYDLILLLDVIEHVPDDLAFLKKTVKNHLAAGGRILITAPAFQSLYSGHDRFLGHKRRYRLSHLKVLAEKAGLNCVRSGYLFTSLLLPRFLSRCIERAFKTKAKDEGVGNWRYGKASTKPVELFLRWDNGISLAMNRFGIKLPGLTGWVLCERQR